MIWGVKVTDIPWSRAASLRFFHSRLSDDGNVKTTLANVQNMTLRMAVEEACVQRQGGGLAEMSICLVDGTRAWCGEEIADLERQLQAVQG